jgi:hypothetical protein
MSWTVFELLQQYPSWILANLGPVEVDYGDVLLLCGDGKPPGSAVVRLSDRFPD